MHMCTCVMAGTVGTCRGQQKTLGVLRCYSSPYPFRQAFPGNLGLGWQPVEPETLLCSFQSLVAVRIHAAVLKSLGVTCHLSKRPKQKFCVLKVSWVYRPTPPSHINHEQSASPGIQVFVSYLLLGPILPVHPPLFPVWPDHVFNSIFSYKQDKN